MDDLAPFDSPKELIAGAKEHLAELERACTAFGGNCPYEIFTHIDSKTREKVVRLRLKTRMPPKIRRLASTILKELRLALDQTMCDGAIELGRANGKDVYFPFGKSVKDLRYSRLTKCKGVDRRLVAFALKFKPYYGGNPALWSLSRLAGLAHQRIIGAKMEDRAGFVQAVVGCKGPLQLVINKWNNLHNELEVARIPANSHLTVKNDFILRIEVVFAESGEALAYRPLARTIYDLIGICERVVLGLEAETARILSGRTP